MRGRRDVETVAALAAQGFNDCEISRLTGIPRTTIRDWRRDRFELGRRNGTNVSDDIKQLFCESCDALGVGWRRMNAMPISIARRQDVARLDEFVGPKA